MTTAKQVHIDFIARALADFFKEDPAKITHWLLTDNLNFGGYSPAELIAMGRAHKVAQFVASSDAGEGLR